MKIVVILIGVIPRSQRCRVKSVIKIGEGTFSEVFACRQENVAIKLFPIEGSKNAMEVISDVIASREVTRLTRGTLDKTENFAQLKRVSLLHGKLPAYLIKAWEHFRRLKGSENDHPSKHQNSTGPLEFQMPSCPVARLSIFTQTALALAVAERRLRFEHRDLHWGNLLIDYVNKPLFLDLSKDQELFSGDGDPQFEIYRRMRQEVG
ncbi:unnamed protein product [Mesocestoides corti]|uniref:Protein kinase domain-containing protein n=1 Tax=Mesocestoides corti TaxID=53468 RepID=A0A0R3U2M4_MESCO|nr:unnamed protein product [Mesocestoides corti]